MNTEKNNEEIIALGVDVEASGMRWLDEGHILAIGARVVNSKLETLDKLFIPMYVPLETVEATFKDKRTYNEYWVGQDQLHRLEEFKAEISPRMKELSKKVPKCDVPGIEERAIIKFQAFRAKWETKCRENGWELKLVSDNPVFDGAFINFLIQQYIHEKYPIPYSSSDFQTKDGLQQVYMSFDDTGSMKKGVLAVVCSDTGSTSKKLEDYFDLPTGEDVQHDHNPVNDAYTIARDAQYIYGISKGIYKRKNYNLRGFADPKYKTQ